MTIPPLTFFSSHFIAKESSDHLWLFGIGNYIRFGHSHDMPWEIHLNDLNDKPRALAELKSPSEFKPKTTEEKE